MKVVFVGGPSDGVRMAVEVVLTQYRLARAQSGCPVHKHLAVPDPRETLPPRRDNPCSASPMSSESVSNYILETMSVGAGIFSSTLYFYRWENISTEFAFSELLQGYRNLFISH